MGKDRAGTVVAYSTANVNNTAQYNVQLH